MRDSDRGKRDHTEGRVIGSAYVALQSAENVALVDITLNTDANGR